MYGGLDGEVGANPIVTDETNRTRERVGALDLNKGLDGHRSKTLIPVVEVDAVPSWTVGKWIQSRWTLCLRLGVRDDARIQQRTIANEPVPVAGQLAYL